MQRKTCKDCEYYLADGEPIAISAESLKKHGRFRRVLAEDTDGACLAEPPGPNDVGHVWPGVGAGWPACRHWTKRS